MSKLERQANPQEQEIAFPNIVKELQGKLSTRLTAFIALYDPEAPKEIDAISVQRWADGDAEPSSDAEQRLRVAFETFDLITRSGDSDRTARAWFIGINPRLEHRTPAEMLTEGKLVDVLSAARAYVSGSY